MAIIYDYTEYKLHALMEKLASENRYDDADIIRLTLDAYLLGQCTIEWFQGVPYANYVEEYDILG